MGPKNPWRVGNASGFCAIRLMQQFIDVRKGKACSWQVLHIYSCACPRPGILWLIQGENESDFVPRYPWPVINRHRKRSESVFLFTRAWVQISGASGGCGCLDTGERWKGQTAAMGPSGNSALITWIFSDLIYALFHIVPTYDGWYFWQRANISASNYFQIHCRQLQI